MSWLQYLGAFAGGFVQGLAESRAERAQASHGYDFTAHMQMLGRESQFGLVTLTPSRATFNVNIKGQSYALIAVLQGDMIVLCMCSQFRFPCAGAPHEVCRFLVNTNREMKQCDFGLIDDDDGAFFYIHGKISIGRLGPEALEAAIEELAPKIWALDATLVKNGYAS